MTPFKLAFALSLGVLTSACQDLQDGCQPNWCPNAYWKTQCLSTCGACESTGDAPTNPPTDAPNNPTPAPITTTGGGTCADAYSACQTNWCGDAYWKTQCLNTCGACEGTGDAPTNPSTGAPTNPFTPPNPTPAPTLAPTNPFTPTNPTPAPSGDGGGVEDVISRAQWDEMFTLRHTSPNCVAKDILTYDNFVTAVNQYYPSFGAEGSMEVRKREAAAFLGQISQETTGWWTGQEYAWGLCFIEEVGCESGCPQYTSGSYPSVPGQSYHGRGAMQITWNYNYGPLSEVLYGDANVLLQNPGLLAADGVLAFRASLWFWMTPQTPKPSAHSVMVGTAEECPQYKRFNGYGQTTNIINGGLECSKPTPQKVENRVQYFERYCTILGVSQGDNLYCDQMTNYGQAGYCPN